MPKTPPRRPSTPRKTTGPTSKPPAGGKSTKSQFGDYMNARDLGQSKGRSAAVGRRAASIKALANNTQGKIMSTNPKSAVMKPIPKRSSSGNPIERAVDTVAKGAGKVAGAYVNATIKNPAKAIASIGSKSMAGTFAGKRPTKAMPVNASGMRSSRAENKTMLKQAKGQTALKARLKTVDYNALGKMMTGKKLPKTK